MTKTKKRKDLNQLAKDLVDQTTDGKSKSEQVADETPKAKAGRKGGLTGGVKRARKLSAERRKEIAQQAALARWRKSS